MSLPDFAQQSNVDLKDRVSGFFGNEVKHDNLVTSIEDIYKDVKALHDNVVVMEDGVEADATQVRMDTIEVRELSQRVFTADAETKAARDEAVAAKDRAVAAEVVTVTSANSASSDAGKAKLSEELAMNYAHDAHGFANNSLLSSEESQKYFNYSYAIYEDLRKGQVYRGTWNPHTGAYPSGEGANSSWDVILNEGEAEYTWDGKKWFWGDRLVYVKDTNTYQQIESGTGGGVTSVNGKKGAVTLNHEDVHAAPEGFGLGGEGKSLSNLSCDDVNESGFYSIYASTTGTPDPSGQGPSGSSMIHTRWGAGAGASQMFFSYTSNRVFWRRKYTGAWEPWQEFYTTSRKPSATDVGALPVTGGTMTGPIVVANQKGAIKVHDQKSISFQDQSNVMFHQFAEGNTFKINHGNNGENPVMSLTHGGTLEVEGPAYARTGVIAKSRGGSNGGTWLAIETPEEGAPYISSKVNAENSASVAIRFGRTEISVENSKRMAANEFRVATDAGLKFAPTNDISGSTWGVGINSTDRNFGIHRYTNSVWSNQSLYITPDDLVGVNKLAVHGPSESTYHQIKNNGNPSLELHHPGNSAVMMYKPQGKNVVRFCQSNGAGGESNGFGEVSLYGFETVNGRFASTYISSDRAWTAMGQNHFHGSNAEAKGHGTLFGVVGKQHTYSGHWALENYYGIWVGTNQANDVAHTLVSTDGGGYLRQWFMYNDGRLQSPSTHAVSWSMSADGTLSGSAFGGYGSMIAWCVASFAPASDERLKKNIKPAVKKALDDVEQIKFYSYEWDEHTITRDKKGASIGVLAQEMELIDSDYVRNIKTEGEECIDVKALDITNTLTLALKAIQELSEANKELTERVATLEALVTAQPL